ncbi:MAG: DEAD/DEAH box helicase [Desulfuromonadaceae bacterium]|nr:DEAD/DEAH box helicase [Desulfuromonadaceae bacterium]
MKFTELALPDQVLKGIEGVGFVELTPVQEAAIPLALGGKDVAVQAQTGTGKTAAFLIALFTRLLATDREVTSSPRALILAPTRELVAQICADAKGLGAFCPIRVQAVFGGIDYQEQRQALQKGVDVIVATPGRLIDYAKQRVFSLRRVEALVIDEADRMFDMGFIKDLRYILRQLPSFEKRQNMLFSATLSSRVMELAYEFMNAPERVEIHPEQITADRIEQILYHAGRREKFPLLLGLLKKEAKAERVLIFVNTKGEADFLGERLRVNDLRAAVISGDIPQRKRMRILDDFKAGRLTFLVGTDVASRGLHIEGVTHVINYDLPLDAEDYVHRIGRTARAGAAGKAISFADEELVYRLPDIEQFIGGKIPSSLPVEDDFCWDYKRSPPRKKGPLSVRTPAKAKEMPRRSRPSRRSTSPRKKE